jgi:signal transduction histidine kinase
MRRGDSGQAPDRIEVHSSLYRALLEHAPGLRPTAVSKGALVAASHLIEGLVAEAEGPTVLLSGFQHLGHWAAERDRYLRLSEAADVIAVFAGEEPPPEWRTDHVGVRLAAGNPLEQEWFVLAMGPSLAITLCGLDGAAHGRSPGDAEPLPEAEADRVFDVVWSFDPEVARAAADGVVAAVERDAPERAADVRARVARAHPGPSVAEVAAFADHATAGLLERLEQLHRRERAADRRASTAKTEFLSRMSHELRTPLNAILGFAQLLEGSELPPDDADSVVQIRRAGRHLLTLVDELLDISRIESGALPVHPAPVPVRLLVADAVALAAPGARDRGIAVDDTGVADELTVRTDRRHAVQVLLNLLANAVKYDRPDGTVTVAARRDGAYVRIDVRDTGPGIEAADLAEIFAPFTRLRSAPAGSEGTGLGLTVSRTLAEALGGRIDVASTPGRGSTFTLVLPAADPGDGPG